MSSLISTLEKIDINFPIYYGLTIEQMTDLGLHISEPRSDAETDHPFAEPGNFVLMKKISFKWSIYQTARLFVLI